MPGNPWSRSEVTALRDSIPASVRRCMPGSLKRVMSRAYWWLYDSRDFVAEVTGGLPSHCRRMVIYRHVLRMRIGSHSSIHRRCRFYFPRGVVCGAHTIINREVLIDGRSGVVIGDNVSISEGAVILTLEHDPQSPVFENRGAPVHVGNRVFVGARAIILPGVSLGEGCVVAAGAVVTHDVAPYAIVGGVPARTIGERTRELTYELNYRKFLG